MANVDGRKNFYANVDKQMKKLMVLKQRRGGKAAEFFQTEFAGSIKLLLQVTLSALMLVFCY